MIARLREWAARASERAAKAKTNDNVAYWIGQYDAFNRVRRALETQQRRKRKRVAT